MTKEVGGDRYYDLDGQLLEIKRQLRQPNGYPFDLEMLEKHLKAAIEGRFRFSSRDWPTWRTIKLGTGLKTANDFHQVLEAEGLKIGDWGSDILGKPAFIVASEPTEIELVRATVVELGFHKGAYRKDIYKRAFESGLALCPNEVGPQLRHQYKDQPKGEWLLIAMEPIAGSDGYLVFRVGHGNDDLWLDAYGGDSDCFWLTDDVWVFARSK